MDKPCHKQSVNRLRGKPTQNIGKFLATFPRRYDAMRLKFGWADQKMPETDMMRMLMHGGSTKTHEAVMSAVE